MKKQIQKYVIFARGTGKEMTYDGKKFSERAARQFTSKKSAIETAKRLIAKFFILEKYVVGVRPTQPATILRGKKAFSYRSVRGRKKNPVETRNDPQLAQAARLLEDFSGHAPTEILRVNESPMRKGLVIGTLDGVLYTTVRDGKTEKYIHRFKKSSRPLLTARADGKQLGIVGGRFQMTEAGIEDR